MLEMVQEIYSILHELTQVPPILILPVVLLVEGLAIITKLKTSDSPWRGSLLGLICGLVGLLIIFLTVEFSTWREVVNKGIILGSLSALSYQLVKPVFKFMVKRGYQYLRDKFGGELKDPDF